MGQLPRQKASVLAINPVVGSGRKGAFVFGIGEANPRTAERVGARVRLSSRSAEGGG